MSLINEMLHDLEKRRKQKTQQIPVVDIVMSAKTGMTGRKILSAVAAMVLLAAVVWGGFFHLPTMLTEKTQPRKLSPEQTGSIIPTEQQSSIPISPMTLQRPVEAEKHPPPMHTVLSEMTLSKEDGAALLFLKFTRPPQYSLLQSGQGNVPLSVMFNKTTRGEHLQVPEVTSSVLESMRLQPGREHLQLLVDLAAGTQLESLELVENSEAEYSLIMDFVQQNQTRRPNEEEQPYPLSLDKISDTAKTNQTVVNMHAEEDVSIPPPEQKIVLTKKGRLPSGDIQSYQAGLGQLHRGELAAAARSFASTLAIYPTHTKGRLQLIATLQQLKQPEQAAEQMRQGLKLMPENRVLRKEYARYLLDNRQIGRAIKLLRQSPVPAVADDMEYHALLAALLQKSGRYGEAAKVYTQLLQIRPKNGIWWLGLAVSMDQTSNYEQAREAYRQALNLSGVNQNTREYIKNRFEILSEGHNDGW